MAVSLSTLLLARKYTDEQVERAVDQINEGGGSGASGARAETFVHNQSPASSVWTIEHSLDNYPTVTVVDSAGNVVIGDVQYQDRNTVVITFESAFSGKAYLN